MPMSPTFDRQAPKSGVFREDLDNLVCVSAQPMLKYEWHSLSVFRHGKGNSTGFIFRSGQ
ncbi:hypothetical protein AGR1C_pAt40335 [Agrobacterium fabacearum TT111]|nr:hypothetical protein AGR1C_pAt40335 [Agrobacterium fabacearum TT111]